MATFDLAKNSILFTTRTKCFATGSSFSRIHKKAKQSASNTLHSRKNLMFPLPENISSPTVGCEYSSNQSFNKVITDLNRTMYGNNNSIIAHCHFYIRPGGCATAGVYLSLFKITQKVISLKKAPWLEIIKQPSGLCDLALLLHVSGSRYLSLKDSLSLLGRGITTNNNNSEKNQCNKKSLYLQHY